MGADFYGRRLHPDRSRYAVQLRLSRFQPDPEPAVAVVAAQPVLTAPEPPAVKVPPPVALLCCGPSVGKTWRDAMFDTHALVIAVNTAPWTPRDFRHHWLAASDKHIFDEVWPGRQRRPLVGCLTNKAFGPQAQALGLKWIRPATFDDNKLSGKATSYTMVGALWFAVQQAEKHGTHVEIHGYDCTHTPDAAGLDRPHSHAPARFRSEAVWLRALWHKDIICHGQASASLLAYLRGETDKCKL